MSLKSLKRHFGWLIIDHSASPGIPADIARTIGLPPELVAEGKIAEFHTLSCCECGTHVVLRPDRTRPRAYCKICDHYICDICDYKRTLPGWVHRPRDAPQSPKGNPVSIIVP